MRWGWGWAGLCWGHEQGLCTVPQSHNSCFSMRELLAFVTGQVWCGAVLCLWDWPLLSLPAAFPTSGNAEKPGNAGMGRVGDSCWSWSSIKTAKPPNCPWGSVWPAPGAALAELGLLGWNRWGKYSPNLPELCRGGSKLGWAGLEGTARLCFLWEHKKYSRMRVVVPEVVFPPSNPGFLWLPSPAATTALDKRAFRILSSKDVAGRGDCPSWALLSEAERVCDLKLNFLRGSRTTAAVPVPQMRKSCFLALGKWFSPVAVGFFLQFLICSTKPVSKHIPKNGSGRESVLQLQWQHWAEEWILYLSRDCLFSLADEPSEMFKHPTRTGQDQPWKWQEKSELPPHPSLLWGVCVSHCFRVESLQSCSGPWLPGRGVWGGPTALQGTVQVPTAGRHRTRWGESPGQGLSPGTSPFNHLMSSGCRNGALLLNFSWEMQEDLRESMIYSTSTLEEKEIHIPVALPQNLQNLMKRLGNSFPRGFSSCN